MQTRAETTRRKILAAAVDLFDETGYGDTGLNDIVARAELTKGAFYYHFDSKEAIANAIIEEMDLKIATAVAGEFDANPPTLETVLRTAFVSQRLLGKDKAVRVGGMLTQANNQVTLDGPATGLRIIDIFVAWVGPVLAAYSPPPGTDTNEVARVVCMALFGHNQLSRAHREDAAAGFQRMSRLFKVMMPILVPPDQVAHYQDVVDAIARRYEESEPDPDA